MQICEIKKCTGCFACKSVCPQKCISVGIDELGKTYPIIDPEKCINCGLCKKVCPENTIVEKRRAQKAYAIVSKSLKDKVYSSSGGVASVLARQILAKGGVVFGCASLDGEIKQIAIKEETQVDLLRGSKYVQSDTADTYVSAKEELKKGIDVLYIGTPCQIAGLKNFLQKDYDNLYTVDLICHGTPPNKYLKEHIQSIRRNKYWDRVSFRGENNFFLTVYSKEKIVYKRRSEHDVYFMGFLEGVFYRDNCYDCPYAKEERCADLTLGDFWGLDRTKLQLRMEGRVSLALPNTEKGERLLDFCQNECLIEARPFEEAANPKQGNLMHPSVPHADRQVFFTLYPELGFEKAIRKTAFGKNVEKKYRKDKVLKPFKKAKRFFYRSIKKLIKK